MDMTGERRIPASRQMVWDALNDPEVLKASIPGCKTLEKTSDTDMKATAAIKIGPISAQFTGKVQLLDLDPPNGYRIAGEGQGGVAGFANGGATVKLTEDGAFTVLSYEVKAQVGGKIAQLGARLIDATAKQMADQFFDRFSAQVAGPEPVVANSGPAGVIAAVAEPVAAAFAPEPAPTVTPVIAAAPSRGAGHAPPGPAAALHQHLRPDPAQALWLPNRVLDRCGDLLLHLRADLRKLRLLIPASVDATAALLATQGYVADRGLATTVHFALAMGRPLFLEGEPGTGKTEIAKVLAAGLGRRLVRLQCYDGMDLAAAAYEWDRARQFLAIRLAEATGATASVAQDIYARAYLQPRPLLAAIDPDLPPAVLLIDELDRADEPFEAFLLELLADFQITIPEYGTIRAATPPVVVLTSNRTREVHDAIRRRCLYQWVDYPDAIRERAILATRLPGLPARLAAQVVAFVQHLRQAELFKLPGVAETIDWANALSHMNQTELTPQAVDDTLGVLVKYQDDIARVRGDMAARLVGAVQDAA